MMRPKCRITARRLAYGKAAAVLAAVHLTAIILFISACSTEKEPGPHFTIGLITNNRNGLKNIQGFQDKLVELGYIAGKNVEYIFNHAPVSSLKLESSIQQMLDAGVDLIFTAGTPTGVVAHKLTMDTSIPVIFGVIADPIAAGVLEDLSRPGGNMTGVKLGPNQAKRLHLFLELAPATERLLIPYNPDDAASTSAIEQINHVAGRLGVTVVETTAKNEKDVFGLLDNFPGNVDAVFLVPGTTVNVHLAKILEVTRALKIPISGPSLAQVKEGAVMTYGFDHILAGKQAARIADQVLRGMQPGDLPVETAEFMLAVNLEAAQMIGLEVPYDILQRAEIIIRADQ